MGRVHYDLGNISGNCRLKQRLHACSIGRNKRSHRPLWKLSGRFREQSVHWEVRQRNLDSGCGRESERKHARQSSGGKTPRYNSASNGLAERAIRTIGEQLRSPRYDTQNRYKTQLTLESTVWPWLVRRLILCYEICAWSGWHHTVHGSA